jgi:hypothetical protein
MMLPLSAREMEQFTLLKFIAEWNFRPEAEELHNR